VEFNQTYQAPSITKLSKRTIASPFGEKSAVSTPKLKKTSFSFIKKSSLAETIEKTKDIFKPLESVKSDVLITNALVETNQSLVEIKNQLEKFFALSIAEEKETLKKFKSDKARRRFTLKENVVESAKKIGSGLFKQVDQVLAPTKSIFQKLIDFFGIILTGIVVNSAFKWLENPENQKKVSQVFEFLAKNWKWILGLLGGAYLLGLLYKIYKVGKLVFGIVRLIRGLFGKKPPAPPKGIATPKTLSPGSTSRLNQSYAKFIEGKANIGDRGRLARRGFIKPNQILSRGGVEALKGTVKTPTPNLPRGGKTFGRGGIVGSIALTLAEIFKPQIQDFVGGMYKTVGLGYGSYSDERLKNEYKKEKELQSKIQSGPLGEYASSDDDTLRLLENEIKKRGLKLNAGGTVMGKDKRNQDSVSTLLTVGEEVVNKTSSMLFRPLIKDLNDNAGRLWNQFTQAVTQLTATNQQQKKISDVFGRVIKDFNKFLEDQIRQAKLKNLGEGGGTGGPISLNVTPKSTAQPSKKKKTQTNKLGIGGADMMRSMKTPPPPQVSVYAPQQNIKPVIKTSTASNVSQPIAMAKPSMIPFAFDLPPIKAPTPQVPSMPSPPATEVPAISSVNMANPYMYLTQKIYGIHVV
jgi:hypothetical protein